jgi:diguanylate cyclase
MSQRDTDNIEATRWKKKFLDALEVHDSREKSLINRIRLLRRGLVGVSLAGDGLDTTLDRELNALRTALRTEDSESGLEVLLERIEKSVLRLDTRKEQSTRGIQNALTLSAAQLQELDVSRELKRAIKQYAKTLPGKLKDSQSHAELIIDLLELLRMVVRELTHQPETEATQPTAGFWSRLFSGSSGTDKPEPAPSAPDSPASAPAAPTAAAPAQAPMPVSPSAAPAARAPESPGAPAAAAAHSSASKPHIIVSASMPSEPGRPKSAPDVSDVSEHDDALDAALAPEQIELQEIPALEEQAQPESLAQEEQTSSVADEPPAADVQSGDQTGGPQHEPEPAFSVIANHAEPLILRILENIYISEQSVGLASRIRSRVARGLNWYEFVAVLEDIATVITTTLEQERSEFQRFLNELNASLGQVQEYVQFSREQEGVARESEKALDAAVRTQISGIAESVQVAENIGELKTAVQGQLSTILSSMDQFKEMKRRQQDQSSEHSRQLEERLLAMEAESRELRLHLAQQEQLASRDALTELPNRAAYDRRVRQEVDVWRDAVDQGGGTGLCLVVADVDHFKHINDNYGHLAGDKVLRILAKEISARVRQTDFVARYGGEEFVVLLNNITLDDAEKLMNNVRQKIEKCPFHFKEKQVQITMSFGIAEFGRNDMPESAFERADKALYRAKQGGRNRVCLAESREVPPAPKSPA